MKTVGIVERRRVGTVKVQHCAVVGLGYRPLPVHAIDAAFRGSDINAAPSVCPTAHRKLVRGNSGRRSDAPLCLEPPPQVRPVSRVRCHSLAERQRRRGIIHHIDGAGVQRVQVAVLVTREKARFIGNRIKASRLVEGNGGRGRAKGCRRRHFV